MQDETMELKFNVSGDERKRLVAAMGEILGVKPKYLGAPTFGYEVGEFNIDKEGAVTYNDSIDTEQLINALIDRGFSPDVNDAPDSLTISYPRELLSDDGIDNLRRIIAGKETLIKKALGVDALPIEVDDEKVSFPWFEGFPVPEDIKAYSTFIGKLIGMAKSTKRVTAKDTPCDNYRYAMRCFLLRLGYIGAEYRESRKILLRNLPGSSAFRDGQGKTKEGGND